MGPFQSRSHGPLRIIAPAFLVGLGLVSCTVDPAEKEYLAALRGEEEGVTRQEQIAMIDHAIALAPGRAHYYETRAIYRIDLREFDAALRDLDRAIELSDRPYLRFLRGLVLCQSGTPERSLSDFDLAIRLEPANTQFYRGRSLARTAVGRGTEALEDAERLVRMAPQWAETYYARGVALALLQRDPEALADFDEAIRRRPELVYPVDARASCRERLGQSVLAAEDRTLAASRRREHPHCALCEDPYRY